MLKPFKTTHHFEAVLETGMVCLIAQTKQNNSDLLCQTRTIFLKLVSSS